MEINDNDVVRKVIEGDREKFIELYDVYIDKIYSFIYYRVNQHVPTTEDLTSQVFIKVFNMIKSYDSTKSVFSTWIHTIARNTVIDHYRSQKPSENIDVAWNIAAVDNLSENLDNHDKLNRVKYLLNSFSQDHQEIIIMRLWDDLTFKQISEISNQSEDNCRQIVSRATKKIRATII